MKHEKIEIKVEIVKMLLNPFAAKSRRTLEAFRRARPQRRLAVLRAFMISMGLIFLVSLGRADEKGIYDGSVLVKDGASAEAKEVCIRDLIQGQLAVVGKESLKLTSIDRPFQLIENDKVYRFAAQDNEGHVYNGKVVAFLGQRERFGKVETYCRMGATYSFQQARCRFVGCPVETFRLEMLISSQSGDEAFDPTRMPL